MQENNTKKKSPFAGRDEIIHHIVESKTKREEYKKALFEAMQVGKNKNWDTLIDICILYPVLMDRLCSTFYRELPDEYKYILPVKLYMNGGRCADSVVKALQQAIKYRPENWIGREMLTSEVGFDVFIGTRESLENAKRQISWATAYGTAYLQAQKISGKVYRGYIDAASIIAINRNSVENVIQYDSIMGAEQIFPRLPVSLI